MSAKKLREELEFMGEFKRRVLAFYEARQPLLDMRRERDEMTMTFTVFHQEEFKRRSDEILPVLIRARENVARVIPEATAIVDRCDIPSQVKIFPPPTFGGLIQTLNIFEAVIEPELPHDFNLEPHMVFDVIDKTMWECERRLKTAGRLDVRGKAARLALGFISFLAAIFKSETDRAIVKWVIIIGLIAFVLRYALGIPLENIGKVVFSWLSK